MKKDNNFWFNFGKACGCHQIKERSFHFHNKQFFLCSRCTGIFISEIVLVPILYILSLHFGFYTILFSAPLIIDGLLQYFNKLESTNIRRFITGLLGGYGFGIFIIHLIVQIVIYIT